VRFAEYSFVLGIFDSLGFRIFVLTLLFSYSDISIFLFTYLTSFLGLGLRLAAAGLSFSEIWQTRSLEPASDFTVVSPPPALRVGS